MMIFPKQKNKGYTLLFAVLVSALVLSIGISILTISRKEVLITTSARDSAAAFYAADGGVECGAYGDQKFDAFSTTTDNRASLRCGEKMTDIVVSNSGNIYEPYTFSFSVKFGYEGTSCAVVSVKKEYVETSPNVKEAATTIDSRGYNVGWNGIDGPCDVASVKRVERGVRLSY